MLEVVDVLVFRCGDGGGNGGGGDYVVSDSSYASIINMLGIIGTLS